MKTLIGICTLLCSFYTSPAPKLILQITVDQLRADLPYRYQQNFLPVTEQPGFNLFLDQGIVFNNTHYRHAATKTAVGHATLATGAHPSQHGVVGNNWYDTILNQRMYCVADSDTSLLAEKGHSASPKNLRASTFSDELYSSTQGKARIFAVSIKDRGAVLTAGHYGKAFWMNKNTGNMVTSNHYYPQQPTWLTAYNQSGAKDHYQGEKWELLLKPEEYVNNQDNRIYQIPPKGFTHGFPHTLPDAAGKKYAMSLAYTPFGDQLTAGFAKYLIKQHQLGQDDITDYLSVSFSVNDYVGHMFGPNSQEAEDNLLRLDHTLSDLFQYIDQHIGLDQVLIALSADHGVDSIPEYKQAQGFPAMRGNIKHSIQQIEKLAQKKYATTLPLLRDVVVPDVYFNLENIQQANLKQPEVEAFFAQHILALKTVNKVLFASELKKQRPSQDPIINQVTNSYYQGRSGQLVMVLNSSTLSGQGTAASHGSPYRYDTHVPLYFAGLSLTPGHYFHPTSPEDLAPTLSAVMKINLPDKATGKILTQVLKH